MYYSDKENIIRITAKWQGERFEDGRPRVEDKYIEALRHMTLEEAWKPIYLLGYEHQFCGDLKMLHPGQKLVGRAVTATYMPLRPDLHEIQFDIGHEEEGRKGNYNQWVVQSLQPGDVAVVDMYDKIFKGTFLGGNMTTALKNKTVNGGAVIYGGVRDLEQMKQVEGVQVFYRGCDVTPIRECMMTSMNAPCRIGKAICLPGDIVMGDEEGVLFIPCHLVAHVVDGAAKAHVRDIFGFELISTNKRTIAEIDRPWTAEMLEMLQDFARTDPRMKEYSFLDWSKEISEARAEESKQHDDTQTML